MSVDKAHAVPGGQGCDQQYRRYELLRLGLFCHGRGRKHLSFWDKIPEVLNVSAWVFTSTFVHTTVNKISRL